MKTPKHGLTRTNREGRPSGWVRRINGKPKWICSIAEAPTPDAADAIYEGRMTELWKDADKPKPVFTNPMDMLVADLCDLFIAQKKQQIGQTVRGISKGTHDEYVEALHAFCGHRPPHSDKVIGGIRYDDIQPEHFGSFHQWLNTRFGVDRMKKHIIAVRSVFKMATQPPLRLPLVDYGNRFPLPSKKDIRVARSKHRQKHGVKAYEAVDVLAQLVGRWKTPDELKADADRRETSHRGLPGCIRHLVKGASRPMRAMILLGLNAGFGNTDLGELTLPIMNKALATGWIDYERGKTGARRLAWLWPEAKNAVKRYLRHRPKPASPEFKDMLFLTRYGLPFVTDTKDQVSMQHSALTRRLGQTQKGRNFYSLRRTYRSVAAEVGKEMVIDLSMGHAEEGDDMAKVYTVIEQRSELVKIAKHVRQWLLNAASAEGHPSTVHAVAA